jgi:hypothetical protein
MPSRRTTKLSGRLLAFGRLRLFGRLFDFVAVIAVVAVRLLNDDFAAVTVAAVATAVATAVASAAAMMATAAVMAMMTAATIAATRAFTATRLLFAAAGAFTRLLFAAGGFLLAARRFFATRRLAAVVVMPVASPVATPGIRLRLKPDQNDGQRRHSERHTKHNSLHQRSSKKQGPSFGTFVPFTDAHGTMEDRIARRASSEGFAPHGNDAQHATSTYPTVAFLPERVAAVFVYRRTPISEPIVGVSTSGPGDIERINFVD